MLALVRLGDGEWQAAERVPFYPEAEFQALLAETFGQVLATQSDAPAVIAREVVMPDGGRIDILAVDGDGVITVCECKLQSNAGIRREVMGQIMEYAGNLSGMSFREFRARIEARFDGPSSLMDEMAERADDDWDADFWVDEVSERLEAGKFRLVVAVDELAPTLKRSILYLNAHSDFPVMAVQLQRGRQGDVEVLVPSVFAEEQARRKAPSPSSGAEIENPDTVVVAATNAWAEFQRTGAYICQPLRVFAKDPVYLGFYARRRIEPVFPKIVGSRKNLQWTLGTASQLRDEGDVESVAIAKIIEDDLANPDTVRNPGGRYQVVLLDPAAGFEMAHEIKHEGHAAWLRGHRYTSSEALKTEPTTTEELRAAGG